MQSWHRIIEIEPDTVNSEQRRYFARYPGVETVFGRRLWLPEINGGNAMRRQAAERAAINAPI